MNSFASVVPCVFKPAPLMPLSVPQNSCTLFCLSNAQAATSVWPPARWIASQWCRSHRRALGQRKTQLVLAHNLRRELDVWPNGLSHSDSRQNWAPQTRAPCQLPRRKTSSQPTTQISKRPLRRHSRVPVRDALLGPPFNRMSPPLSHSTLRKLHLASNLMTHKHSL